MQMLPTLKEQFRRDAEDGAAWFSEDAFASEHDVNGTRLLCVLCSDARAGRLDMTTKREHRRPEGMSGGRAVLFVRADRTQGEPKRGTPIRVDGKLYTVDAVRPIGGVVLRLDLEANEA
jgi:hypothetical protein